MHQTSVQTLINVKCHMMYTFNIYQLEILYYLIFDASIELNDIEKLHLLNSSLEFELERRLFENVRREKKLLGTVTHLNGMRSIVRFENVDDFEVIGLTEKVKHNHFINEINITNDGKLTIETVFGILIKMSTSEQTKIVLTDVEESEFGKGSAIGKFGFTSDEWTAFLYEKGYVHGTM